MIFGWLSVPSTPLEGAWSLPSAHLPPAIKTICLPPAPCSLQISLAKSSLLPAISFLRLLILTAIGEAALDPWDLFRDFLPTVLCLQEQTCLLEAQPEARTTRKDVQESHWPF